MLLSPAHLAVLGLATLPAAAAESVLGIYVFHRHGDRTSKSYKPTQLTALGAEQVYQSGQYFRSRYVEANGTAPIINLSRDVVVYSQLAITAPTDTVLWTSANSFSLGLYPPAGTAAQQTLANGSVVEAPLGGYQSIPIATVSSAASSDGAEDSTWLQASSGCGRAVASSNAYLLSDEYLATLASTEAFYQDLLPVLNTTFSSAKASFQNAYTIYDYVHVSEIHNQSIPSSDLLTDDALLQLQTRADQHEWGLAYNASEPVRAIAGAVLAGQILEGLNTTVLAAPAKASTTRVNVQFGAYASFMSFFGLAQLPAASPRFYGIVDYASSIVFELVTNATVNSSTAALDPSDISVRFLLSNSSAALNGVGLQPYPLFGGSDELVSWPTFVSEMDKIAISSTTAWCQACGNTTGVCASTDSSNSTASTSSNSKTGGGGVSRPVAGVIGAMVTLAVILGLEALVLLAGGLRVVKKTVAVAGKPAAAAAASPSP